MNQEGEDKMNLDRALRDLMLEASEEELREMIAEAGENAEDMTARVTAAAQRALDATADTNDDVCDLHRGLGALVRMLRRRAKLSIPELALRADVDPEQVRRIEDDPAFDPYPRTIVQLEQHFKLKTRSLVLLSGAVTEVDTEVREEAVRFAASSNNMSGLSRDERKALNRFVKFLREHTD